MLYRLIKMSFLFNLLCVLILFRRLSGFSMLLVHQSQRSITAFVSRSLYANAVVTSI